LTLRFARTIESALRGAFFMLDATAAVLVAEVMKDKVRKSDEFRVIPESPP
jgi:hypothetical protein